jgi:hypothetical protein
MVCATECTFSLFPFGLFLLFFDHLLYAIYDVTFLWYSDTKTMSLLPGVIVGEMGPTAGLNGIDNGFATFNNVRIPRESMLNRTGDVTPDGRYVSPFKVVQH